MSKYYIYSLLLVSLFSCRHSITDPENSNNNSIVNFTVGNQYYYRYMNHVGNISGGPLTKTILRDTNIISNHYYVFSSGEILHSSETSVVQWNGSSSNILYKYDVQVGDTLIYQGRTLSVTSVKDDSVFLDLEKIVTASNVNITSDTIITISYASKYGLLNVYKTFSNSSWSTWLNGAKINGVSCGSQ